MIKGNFKNLKHILFLLVVVDFFRDHLFVPYYQMFFWSSTPLGIRVSVVTFFFYFLRLYYLKTALQSKAM